jgi:hypothetical protein
MHLLMMLQDSIVLIFAIFICIRCIQLYLKVKVPGYLWILLSFLYMLSVRSCSLYATITQNIAMKSVISNTVLPFWIFMFISVDYLWKETNKIIKR